MSTAVIPREWLRGVLEPCLLALVADGDTYGYELANRLQSAGIQDVSGGTLYPALLRLERAGLLRSEWRAGDGGPGRKYYGLTGAGHKVLAARAAQWNEFSATVTHILQVGTR